MTKQNLRRQLLDEENRLNTMQNGRLEAVQRVFDVMYNTLSKTEYDLLKSFLRVEGRCDEIERLLQQFQDNR